MGKINREFSSKSRQTIHARAEGLCELMIPGVCRGNQALQYHHRKNRSQCGMGTVDNGLLACLWCHEYIGKHPAESYEQGWLVKSNYDPGAVKVARRGRVVVLDDSGGVEIMEGGNVSVED